MNNIKVIAGLGNPGTKYSMTRHNTGFIAVDYLASEMNLKFKAGKGEYHYATGKLSGHEFYILRPSTYMNESGIAVKEFLGHFSLTPENLLLVYDDFNLPLGTLRLRTNGSDGGHNGVSSVIYHLITMDFARMRIGIGREKQIAKDEYVDFVLSDFLPDEADVIQKLLPVYRDCLISCLREDFRMSMNRFNRNFLADENKGNKKKNETEENTEQNSSTEPDDK